MKQREIESAKRILNSRARLTILEDGMSGSALLILDMLGEMESFSAEARGKAIQAILLMIEVVGHGKQTTVVRTKPEAAD